MPEGPVYLTTHQVARMLGVSLPTVVNWTRSGKLTAHKTPGGHRRISREHLLAFARAFQYPLPAELQIRVGPPRVLVVDADRDFFDLVSEYFALKGEVEVRVAEGPFTAGLEVGRFRPDVMLVDLGLSTLDPIRLARLVTAAELGSLRLIGVTGFPDPHLESRARSVGYRSVLHKPVSLEAVWAAVQEALKS